MIRLLFVGDGDRDAVTVPNIVETVLENRVGAVTRNWARLHGGGLMKKIRFAVLDGESLGARGTVMTVDRDRFPAGYKIRALVDCRTQLRQEFPPFPMALGCANPHGEAWLLSDQAAVRRVLRLDGSARIPSATSASPKESLESLLSNSARAGERPLEIWTEIAQALDPERCAHRKETGFGAFIKEIQSEIGPLVDERKRRS